MCSRAAYERSLDEKLRWRSPGPSRAAGRVNTTGADAGTDGSLSLFRVARLPLWPKNWRLVRRPVNEVRAFSRLLYAQSQQRRARFRRTNPATGGAGPAGQSVG